MLYGIRRDAMQAAAEALSQLRSHRSHDCAYGFGYASLAADYLPEITRVDAQLEHGNLRAFDRADPNLVGVIHEGLCDGFY
jgi:hypothetical protein